MNALRTLVSQRIARAGDDRHPSTILRLSLQVVWKRLGRALTGVLWIAFALASVMGRAFAQSPSPVSPSASSTPAPPDEEPVQGAMTPELGEAPKLGALGGKPIRHVEVRILGDKWQKPVKLTRVRLGEPLTLEAARRAMQELLESARFARASVEAVAEGDGVSLVVHALPRRLIAKILVTGGALDLSDTLNAAGIEQGGEITAPMLPQIADKVRTFYDQHGFSSARVGIDTTDTDDPDRVVIAIEIEAGSPRTISQRVFVIEPAFDKEIGDLKRKYRWGAGARLDEPAFADADREMVQTLRRAGFSRAAVHHAVVRTFAYTYLYVYITPGPRIVPAFEGNRAFDDDALSDALGLDKAEKTNTGELVDKLKAFYVARGFFDVEISVEERGRPDETIHFLVFDIRENRQVRVTRRVFPCLTVGSADKPPFSPDDVGSEIETFLEEDLPSEGALSTIDPRGVPALFGPNAGSGARGAPVELKPLMTYAPETYARAIKHLRELFRSKGYLNAVVGPVTIVRDRCRKDSPAGQCVAEPRRERLVASCRKDALNLPLPEPDVPETFTCQPDPARGIECSPEMTVRIPIQLGPQTALWDLAFEGNRRFTESYLAKEAELELGEPLSTVELESARERLVEVYRDAGFAYAEVRTAIEPSPDRTRARVRFVIVERELVLIDDFVVLGATRTDRDLILGRLALLKHGPYLQQQVRLSEERIATLGTFSSVAIALEDPEVPQRNKRVIITVVEQLPQYLDPRIGFSTGEGLRFGFEYGHRNIGGLAISLVLRVQLGYLFDFMILDQDVRENYRSLKGTERLERRNSASISFPEIGLGPTIGLALEGIDVRDNQRDFGITKEAFIPTVTYRPRRHTSFQVGGSLEFNDVEVFRGKTVADAIRDNAALSRLLLVPDGQTLVVAQRVNATYDRRDSPLAATKGIFITGGVEHVNAFPAGADAETVANIQSHFLRFTGRVAGYVRLTSKGTALALSLAGGYNLQLEPDSKTYPDRLFFLGGVDSLRAFLDDSLVPEDIAQRLLHPDPSDPLTIEQVAIRGGDVSLNPRIELRIPLNETFQLGLFLDTGNLWVDPDAIDFLALRLGPGVGLRFNTPVGPVAFDYGFNVVRRPWEDGPGAFHLSIGLF